MSRITLHLMLFKCWLTNRKENEKIHIILLFLFFLLILLQVRLECSLSSDRVFLMSPPVAEATQEARAVTKSRNMVRVTRQREQRGSTATSRVALATRPPPRLCSRRLPPAATKAAPTAPYTLASAALLLHLPNSRGMNESVPTIRSYEARFEMLRHTRPKTVQSASFKVRSQMQDREKNAVFRGGEGRIA